MKVLEIRISPLTNHGGGGKIISINGIINNTDGSCRALSPKIFTKVKHFGGPPMRATRLVKEYNVKNTYVWPGNE